MSSSGWLSETAKSLFTAIHVMNIPKIKEIIGAHPDIINKNLTPHINVLTLCIMMDSPLDLIQNLIDNGADINKCAGRPNFNATPLVWSLIRNVEESSEFEIARLLINNGADINYRGSNCLSPLEAIIKGDVGGKDGAYHPDEVGMKKKILNFLFNTRDSEGHRVQVEYDPKIFGLAKSIHGPAFEEFVRQKFNKQAARNITAAEEAWRGNKSESSGFVKIPENVLYGKIFPLLGGPEGSLKPDGTRAHLHPKFVLPTLKSGVKIPKGLERPYSQLYEWAEKVRKNSAIRNISQRKPKGGRRRRTRRHR